MSTKLRQASLMLMSTKLRRFKHDFYPFWILIMESWSFCMMVRGLARPAQRQHGWQQITIGCSGHGQLSPQTWTPLKICWGNCQGEYVFASRPQGAQITLIHCKLHCKRNGRFCSTDVRRWRVWYSMRRRCVALFVAGVGQNKYLCFFPLK